MSADLCPTTGHPHRADWSECERCTPVAGDNTLREVLTEALNYSPTDALVTNQHVAELVEHLLPKVRQHVDAAKQAERERAEKL